MSDPSPAKKTIPAPLFHRPFRLLLTMRTASNTANQMQAVAAGWLIYSLTGSALALGFIGLVQFLPPLALTLLAGQVIDRYDRRLILNAAYAIEFGASLGMAILVSFVADPTTPIFVLLFLKAVARTFEAPALQSLVPSTVPREILMSAVSLHASAGKLSQLLGPALGGLLYAVGAAVPFGLCAALFAVAGTASLLMSVPPPPAEKPKVTWSTVMAGLRFIWNDPVMLGAMSLDLAATLFGGVVALLPIFARDILHIGSWGFGLLRASPATGAIIVASLLSHTPIKRAAGTIMLAGVAAYGVATIGFGLSVRPAWSFAMLLLVGAADMLSTVIRQSIIQFATPDEMRGRVFAVNTLFVNCSNQIGMFESGITADLFGAVGSAVLGGTIVIAVVAASFRLFPDLRQVERPDQLGGV